jgi:hypothetical protein
VAVYRKASATNAIGSTSSSVNYNGDDAIALRKKSTGAYVDIFGRIGEDPGTAGPRVLQHAGTRPWCASPRLPAA